MNIFNDLFRITGHKVKKGTEQLTCQSLLGVNLIPMVYGLVSQSLPVTDAIKILPFPEKSIFAQCLFQLEWLQRRLGRYYVKEETFAYNWCIGNRQSALCTACKSFIQIWIFSYENGVFVNKFNSVLLRLTEKI